MDIFEEKGHLPMEEQKILDEIEKSIFSLPLSDKTKILACYILDDGEKLHSEDLLSSWKTALERQRELPDLRYSTFRVDHSGSEHKGFQDLLKRAVALWPNEEELNEAAETATTVKGKAETQKVATTEKGRPVFMFMCSHKPYFEDMPYAVALSIPSNGLFVGMNPVSLMDCVDVARSQEEQGKEFSEEKFFKDRYESYYYWNRRYEYWKGRRAGEKKEYESMGQCVDNGDGSSWIHLNEFGVQREIKLD